MNRCQLDHSFAVTFEWLHRRELIHSEAVALGTLINAFLYEQGLAEAKVLLDSCHVLYRPDDIGCSESEVREVMDRFNELNDGLGRAQNWFHKQRLDDDTFQQMMAAITAQKDGRPF